MTVGALAGADGILLTVVSEEPAEDGENEIGLSTPRAGEIHADLTVGPRIASAVPLRANAGICFQGMNLVGKGFRLSSEEVVSLGYQLDALPDVIKPHGNARDMMQGGEHCYVIDFFGWSSEQARNAHPALYQWLLHRVKPDRDQNNRASYRERWWVFGEARGRLRKSWAGLTGAILTPETAKHRVFELQALPFCPDHSIYAITVPEPATLGLLGSRIHAVWSFRAGSTLEDRPRWRNLTCFDPFPFPTLDETQRARIGELAEAIDAHRKRQQSAFPGLTLTGMYNVLEALRRGDPLSAKERVIHEQGLVSVLRELHDALDRAVFEAYGWFDLAERLVGRPGATTPWPEKPESQSLAEEELLSRLVALNAERAAEEARGLVRWLRPDFQARAAGVAVALDAVDDADAIDTTHATAPTQGTLIDDATDADATAQRGTTAAVDDSAAARGRKPGKRRATAAATVAAVDADAPGPADPGAPRERIAWPKTAPEQARAVAEVLTRAHGPLDLDAIAAHFTGRGRWRDRLPELLDTLTALGRAHRSAETWRGG
jgi:hypothetical protein